MSYGEELGCMNVLVGKTVRSLRLDRKAEAFLIVDTDQGSFCFTTEGDCCSESWFSDFTGVEALLRGLPVTAVRELEVVEEENSPRTRQEKDNIYGWAIDVAGAGSCRILFRNSSNGYYGGDCSLAKEIPDTPARLVAEDLMVETESEQDREWKAQVKENEEERIKRLKP